MELMEEEQQGKRDLVGTIRRLVELAMPDFRYMNEYGYVRFLLT